MPSIAFRLAEHKDNAELLQLMADMPMPGAVRVAYCRDPDFFATHKVEGRISQTIVGVDTGSGDIVGMGTRSIKPAYINGLRANIGYLSGLRVRESYRSTIHLARGYEMLQDLHNDGQADLYLSAVLNDNAIARTLTKSRARLPAYHDIGQFRTMAVSLSQLPTVRKVNGLTLRSATPADVDLLVEFLNEQGRLRQFFPAYSKDDFCADSGLLYGLALEDVLLAFDNNQLDGVVAAWDQKAFRRSVVAGYSRSTALARPLYNLWAKLTRLPVLPPTGSVLDYFCLALTCVRGDNEDVFLALLRELFERNRGRYSFMMAGMHEADPLFSALSRFRHRDYLSRLYAVCWKDGQDLFSSLDGRTPYVELGSL